MTDNPPLIAVTDTELNELRSRLRNTQWPTAWPLGGWAAGTEPGELRRLVAHWADGYDWRAHEAEINALPSSLTDIDGAPVHYLRFDAKSGDALPIVLTHGWPSSFLELVKLARRLATPSRYGGAAEDACHCDGTGCCCRGELASPVGPVECASRGTGDTSSRRRWGRCGGSPPVDACARGCPSSGCAGERTAPGTVACGGAWAWYQRSKTPVSRPRSRTGAVMAGRRARGRARPTGVVAGALSRGVERANSWKM